RVRDSSFSSAEGSCDVFTVLPALFRTASTYKDAVQDVNLVFFIGRGILQRWIQPQRFHSRFFFGTCPSPNKKSNEGESTVEDIHKGGDRKSTRLNSSHVSKSYAVFCLKKKKKKSTLAI